jgi:cytosine/creatinine deaminase
MPFDILIKQAKLREHTKLFDIGITGGKITAIEENIKEKSDITIDAKKNLVTESFVNPHLHLCKVYTREMMDDETLTGYHAPDMGKSMTTIELAALVKENYDERWIIKNVRKALAQAAMYGNLHIRAFADVDSKAKLEGMKALIKAREEFKGIIDIQACAFAQDGLAREPGASQLMREAMQMGADVAGGIPWIELTEADIQSHVIEIFDLAQEFNKDVSMLVDDAGDAGLRSLEAMAVETIIRKWNGRSLAHHARAMELYPQPYFQKVAALLKKADIAVVTDPHTGPLHARVKELLAEKVNVCLGQDDISDAYYPFGRNNMLEVAFLASHMLWMTTAREIETLYDLITKNPARAMNVKNHAIKIGAPASLVVLNAPNVIEALRDHAMPEYVISHGKIIDTIKMQAISASGEWGGKVSGQENNVLNLIKKKEQPLSVRDTLFGDMPIEQWVKEDNQTEPWVSFLKAKQFLDKKDKNSAIDLLQKITNMPNLESRHYLQAWHFLRGLGVNPPDDKAKIVYGVVIEVGLEKGAVIVAVYNDYTARYIDVSGAMVVWEKPNNSLDHHIEVLLDAGQMVVSKIGPWAKERPTIPQNHFVRLNMLTPNGLHFGYGAFQRLYNDPMGKALIDPATNLMKALTGLPSR